VGIDRTINCEISAISYLNHPYTVVSGSMAIEEFRNQEVLVPTKYFSRSSLWHPQSKRLVWLVNIVSTMSLLVLYSQGPQLATVR
jgi:hypothetical protein